MWAQFVCDLLGFRVREFSAKLGKRTRYLSLTEGHNSLRPNNFGEMCVSMFILAHTIINIKSDIKTDYKNIHLYDENRTITNQRESKQPERSGLLHCWV